MILTGKAKEDFKKWLNKEMYYLGRHNFEDRDNNIEDLSDNFQNTLIIDWFDSVGIYITFDNFDLNKCFYSEISNYNNFSTVGNRQECAKNSILKANEIYNSKYQ